MPAPKANRLPFTRPSEMRRVRRAASASRELRAAATGSRGRPSARGKTLVPPPAETRRHVRLEAVQRLVVAAVSGEHDDGLGAAAARLAHELGRVAPGAPSGPTTSSATR